MQARRDLNHSFECHHQEWKHISTIASDYLKKEQFAVKTVLRDCLATEELVVIYNCKRQNCC